MKHSCANVFCSLDGERKGPVQNGDSTACASTRSLATTPVPPQPSGAQPVTYDGAALLPLSNRRARSGCARLERRRLESREEPGDDVAGPGRSRPAATRRVPGLVVPRHDRSVIVERRRADR